MDKKLWYKMLGKEDAYDRSTYYRLNENPIKMKELLNPKIRQEAIKPVGQQMTPNSIDVDKNKYYLLQRKTTGEYYKGGNIHTPTTTMKRDEAARLSGEKIKNIKYNWPMSWDLIDLTEEPGEDNLGGERVNELHFTGETLNQVRKDILDFLSTEHKKLGYANPLDTYHLIQQVLDSGKMNAAAKKIR